MININEVKNQKVIYDGKEGKLIIPLSYSAIKEASPWIEEDHNQWLRNNIKGMAWGFPYIYSSPENKNYILLDTKSKMPTLYSGNYRAYGPGHPNEVPPQSIFSHRPELSKILQIKFNMKHRVRYKMPFTDEELKGYSNKNSFAEAVYNVVNSDRKDIHRVAETYLYDFIGDGVHYIDNEWPSRNKDTEEEDIYFGDNGIKIYTPTEAFKENYLDIDEDSDWPFDVAFYDYDDCEEMETDELQYIDNYMTPKTQDRFREFVDKYEPSFWKNEDISPDIIDEGVYDTFFSNYFPVEWDNESWEVLEALGCAVYRSRKRAVREAIDYDVIYKIENVYNDMSTYISYPQLLHLIDLYGIKDFSEIREHGIQQITDNLQDTWYDAWDVDERGGQNINYAMLDIINKLDKKYSNGYDQSKKNKEEFKKILKQLGFKKHSWWRRPTGDIYVKDLDNPGNSNVDRHGHHIELSDFDPINNTVTYVLHKNKKILKQETKMDVTDIGTEVNNLRIDFPEDEAENE